MYTHVGSDGPGERHVLSPISAGDTDVRLGVCVYVIIAILWVSPPQWYHLVLYAE